MKNLHQRLMEVNSAMIEKEFSICDAMHVKLQAMYWVKLLHLEKLKTNSTKSFL